MSIFRVGQKVVCVDDTPSRISTGGFTKTNLIKNNIYTVQWVGDFSYGSWGVKPALLLEEISRDGICCGQMYENYPYGAHRFRPAAEKKTDISIFKEILAGTRQPEGVEA